MKDDMICRRIASNDKDQENVIENYDIYVFVCSVLCFLKSTIKDVKQA